MKIDLDNISSDWDGTTRQERRAIAKILPHEATGKAIQVFNREKSKLRSYWYWYTLGTLWVSYSGFSDLGLWKRLFRSKCPNRESSLMKPDELAQFRRLPDEVTAYRAHREGETDWIAYTLSISKAAMFATQRGANKVAVYKVNKADIIALFLRRGEEEIIVLDHRKPERVGSIPVVIEGQGDPVKSPALDAPQPE